MILDTEGEKKKGRFFKKESKMLALVEFKKFDFHEICSVTVTVADNTSNNIIHAKFHDPEDLETRITTKKVISSDFSLRDAANAVILPRDFTQDWFMEKQRSGRKMGKEDDEEDYDEWLATQESNKNGRAKTVDGADKINDSEVKVDEPIDATSEENIFEGLNSTNFEPSKEKVIHKPLSILKEEPLFETKNELPSQVVDVNSNLVTDKKTTDEHIKNAYQEGYEKALEDHKKTLGEDIIKNTQFFAEIQKSMQQYKSKVAQDFPDQSMSILQALSEAILQKELELDPKIFTDMVKNAISSLHSKMEDLVLRVHPKMFEIMNEFCDESVKKIIKTDDSLDIYDFKFEGPKESISGSLKDMIKEFLDHAGAEIFKKSPERI